MDPTTAAILERLERRVIELEQEQRQILAAVAELVAAERSRAPMMAAVSAKFFPNGKLKVGLFS